MSYLVSTFYKRQICQNVYNACSEVYKGSKTVQNVKTVLHMLQDLFQILKPFLLWEYHVLQHI